MLLAGWSAPGQASAVPEPDGPWLRISGSLRLRYEGISGQFRSSSRLDNSDHLLVQRTLVCGQARFDRASLLLEVADSRQYGGDTGSALGTSTVNALEPLQFRLGWELGDLGSGRHRLHAGRQTIDLGSRRLVARNRFRNTINAFTGLRWEWEREQSSVQALWTLPVRRKPDDLRSVLDNEIAYDEEDFDLQFAGAFFRTESFSGHTLELFTFLLRETGNDTVQRELVTGGGRLLRAPAPESMDFQLEAAYQHGSSRYAAAGPDEDHRAWFTHVSIGRSFGERRGLRLRLAFDYASGDEDPTDGENNRFDTLFGARRFEFGPTGIYGAFARSNIISPELRVEFEPHEAAQLMVAARAARLASDRDAWTTGLVRDPTGGSGGFVGTQLEARGRWKLRERDLQLEVGGAYLDHGRFLRDAPGGQGTDTLYGYLQATGHF